MTGSKPWPPSFSMRPAHERELEQDEVAAQVGEARARQPRAALHVDALAGQLEVVFGAGPAPASPTSRTTVSSSAAVGSGRLGSASERRLQLLVGPARALGRAP